MLRVALLALLVPTFAIAETGQYGIINGEAVSSDDFPSTVQVIQYAESDLLGNVTQPMCTGTLIAPDTVLTAGHCMEETISGFLPATGVRFWVSFAADHSSMLTPEGAQVPDAAVEAAAWVQHPNWDMGNMQGISDNELGQVDDIALMFLDEAVTDVPFTYLPTADEAEAIVEDLEVDIVGYGQTLPSEGGPFAPLPEDAEVAVRYWSHTFVNLVGSHELQIGAGLETGRKCHGDSGGPTFAEIGEAGDDGLRVIGVTSHAFNTTEDCDVGGVDTRVDAYLDWIDEAMRAACEDGTRVWCDEAGIPEPSAATGDDDDAASDDDDDDGGSSARGSGCDSGCSTAERGAPALLLLPLLAFIRRR